MINSKVVSTTCLNNAVLNGSPRHRFMFLYYMTICLTVVHCRSTMFTTHVQTLSLHSQGWGLSGIIVIHVQNMIDQDV